MFKTIKAFDTEVLIPSKAIVIKSITAMKKIQGIITKVTAEEITVQFFSLEEAGNPHAVNHGMCEMVIHIKDIENDIYSISLLEEKKEPQKELEIVYFGT